MPCHKDNLNKKLQVIPMGLADIKAVTQIEASAHSHPWSEKLFLSNFGQRYFNHLLLDNEDVIALDTIGD